MRKEGTHIYTSTKDENGNENYIELKQFAQYIILEPKVKDNTYYDFGFLYEEAEDKLYMTIKNSYKTIAKEELDMFEITKSFEHSILSDDMFDNEPYIKEIKNKLFDSIGR
jgi:hypothetical protein